MEANPFFEKAKRKKRNWFIIILQTLVVLSALGIISYLFVFSANEVDGPSMEPNFYTHQLYFANRLTQLFDGTSIGALTGLQYQRGDVVVLQIPGRAPYIKRIIGLKGDKIAVRGGYTFVNGKRMIEDYLPPARYTNGGDFIHDGGEEIEVKEGTFIVFGDNRPVSNDSRFSDVALVKKEWIIGKVVLRFWPLNYFGLIGTGTYKLINPTDTAPVLIPDNEGLNAVCGGDCLLTDKGSCSPGTVAKEDRSCPNPPAVRCCRSN